jgi:hypothetical protein
MDYKKFVICAVVILIIIFFLDIGGNKNNQTQTIDNKTNSITDRKKELGINYDIIIDRSSEMSRSGKNFLAIFLPKGTSPTTEQLKTLGEIIRDEYKNESFTMLSFWNIPEAVAKNLSSYDLNSVTMWKVVQEQEIDNQMKWIAESMSYTKNSATGLNRLVIYPEANSGSTDNTIIINY